MSVSKQEEIEQMPVRKRKRPAEENTERTHGGQAISRTNSAGRTQADKEVEPVPVARHAQKQKEDFTGRQERPKNHSGNSSKRTQTSSKGSSKKRKKKKKQSKGPILLLFLFLIVIAAAAVFIGGKLLSGKNNKNTEQDLASESTPSQNSSEEDTEDAFSETEMDTEAETEMDTEAETEAAETTADPDAAVSVNTGMIPVYATIVEVGDNLMHRSVSLSGLQADGTYNYMRNFSHVMPYIQAADLAIINQECVMGGNELGIQNYPCFNVRDEVADTLEAVGFDVVLAATNHIMDQGSYGLQHMISLFKTNHPNVKLIGVHDSWEDWNTVNVVDVNGIKIALINYTDIMNVPISDEESYMVETLNCDHLMDLITRAKEMSDFVIVFPHWGTEYNLSTDEKQAQETEFLANLGVDLVIGTHPHVVEPVTYVDRPDGGKMLVYYSLGNYQSIQDKEARQIGGMAQITLCKTSAGTSIVDFNMQFLINDFRKSVFGLEYYDICTTYLAEEYTYDLALTGGAKQDYPAFDPNLLFSLLADMKAQVVSARQAAGLQ